MTNISVAKGDGIGPEIMDVTLGILEAAGARLQVDYIELGEKVYDRGFTSGIYPDTWSTIRQNKVLLKGPITTPQGGGYKSLNVTLRKTLGLYANVRPCIAYHPFVPTQHPKMDVVIIRENEEDLYAGIEHRQTDEVSQCLKLISRPGTEKIIRFAFEYARAYGRKKVTCFSKDNIMKLTDGLFHKIFKSIAAEYPDLESEHWIVDIGAALLAYTPEQFDVIVMPNLYGDILSDVAAQITGSVGLGGSANIGAEYAMFEAIHGSAPDIAGQHLANPSGLLLSAVQMLVHIDQGEVASRVHNAWLRCMEDGKHTQDLHRPESEQPALNTTDFASAVIERLGCRPQRYPAAQYDDGAAHKVQGVFVQTPPARKELVGVDIFLHWNGTDRDPNKLRQLLELFSSGPLRIQMITNRGVKVYPDGIPETFCTDHWRCRFSSPDMDQEVTYRDVLELCQQLSAAGLDIIKTENLCRFDGEMTFSLGQGQ